MKILLVDDTESLLSFYKLYLNTHFSELEILTATGPTEALAIIKEHDENDFICMITDYEMNEDMDGANLALHTRQIWAKTPIFLHTNTCKENIPDIQKLTQGLNIEVSSKDNSMDLLIRPWIKSILEAQPV